MNQTEFIDRALHIPYAEGEGAWERADCWGLVELYYSEVLEISLSDRGEIEPGHAGMQAGFEQSAVWSEIKHPEDHCLVIMRANGFEAGHVGIFIDGHVLHLDEKTGCTHEPISDRFIRSTITCYLIHEHFSN